MIHENLTQITIQQILIFLEAAKQSSFRHAADTLHLTQPAVSKSIQRLEQKLDCLLFYRTTKELHLTEAGSLLYQSFSRQLKAMNNSYCRVLQMQHDYRVLKIAIPNTTVEERYFWKIADAYSEKYPDVTLDIESISLIQASDRLLADEFDVIFIPDFEAAGLDKQLIKWKWAAKDNMQVIIPHTNPLSSRKSVRLSQLKDENFVVLEEVMSPNYLTDLKRHLSPIQPNPHILKKYKTPDSLKSLYRAKDGVLVVDSYFDDRHFEHVSKIPIQEIKNGIICAWRTDNSNPNLKNFLRIVSISSGAHS